jgi:hypothetical protein
MITFRVEYDLEFEDIKNILIEYFHLHGLVELTKAKTKEAIKDQLFAHGSVCFTMSDILPSKETELHADKHAMKFYN